MLKVRIRKNLSELWRCSKGVTAIEYALIAGTVAAVLIFSIATASKLLDNSFRDTTTELSGMPGTGGSGSGTGGGGGGGTADNSDNSGSGGSGGGTSNDDDDDNDGRGGGRGRGRGR